MVRTITISLPDDMYDKLQTVKDDFNISRVCQSALDDEIEIQSFKKGKTMDDTKKKFQAEKVKKIEEYRKHGEKDAQKDLPEMDLDGVDELAVCWVMDGYGGHEAAINDIPGWFDDQITELEEDDPSIRVDDYRHAYINGYIGAVAEFRDSL